MALINTWFFTKTVIDWEIIAKATHNQFRVASVRPYVDKKGLLPDGYTLTLTVLQDDFDYGVDKSGVPRENNVYQNFDVTVLTRKHDVKKGDIVRLLDFVPDHSFAINFDMILRFKNLEIIQKPAAQAVKPNA